MPFNTRALYRTEVGLDDLASPFSEGGIHKAATQLARNKASGPDRLPNEFLQSYWQVIKDDIYSLFQGFFNNTIDLKPINKANIIMISKKEGPHKVGDYRPISVINLFPKVISKVLANRLATKLPSLISIKQTTFMGGRHIANNFIITRELLHHIQRGGNPTVFLKINFTKAFDSVNWKFLANVMRARGFPDKWVSWIMNLLTSASSRVVINVLCM
jgi:Reverse transcriptase (RNA-dependent DNA polymerase)